MSDAKGLAILTVLKAGFLFSGQGGLGLVVARTKTGWLRGEHGRGGRGAGWEQPLGHRHRRPRLRLPGAVAGRGGHLQCLPQRASSGLPQGWRAAAHPVNRNRMTRGLRTFRQEGYAHWAASRATAVSTIISQSASIYPLATSIATSSRRPRTSSVSHPAAERSSSRSGPLPIFRAFSAVGRHDPLGQPCGSFSGSGGGAVEQEDKAAFRELMVSAERELGNRVAPDETLAHPAMPHPTP
jgi:hypothetical protein